MNTVKKSHIIRVPITDPSKPNNNKRQTNTMETKIERVETPKVVRIHPFYQFFLNFMFKEGITDEEYEVLSEKFLKTFLTLSHENSIKMIRTYYFESSFFKTDPSNFQEENYAKLKEIMDKIYNKCFKKELPQSTKDRSHSILFQRIDVYSFTLLLYTFSCQITTLTTPYDEKGIVRYDEIQNKVYDFIYNNKLLNPDPFELNFNFDDVIRKYDDLLRDVEKIVVTNPSLYNPRL
jgi:hypothetical protein